MSNFEPSIVEVNLYCEDNFINREIENRKLSNINIYNRKVEKFKDTNDKLDFSLEFEYFDEENVQAIIGDKLNNILKGSYDICFVKSKEEFIRLKNFRGIIVCLENSYVEDIRTYNIVVKEKEQAINVILILYYCFNSYHVFPYDLNMVIGDEFNIIIQNIDIKQVDLSSCIVWNYRNINSDKDLKVIFILTKDSSIRQFNCIKLHKYIMDTVKIEDTEDIDSDIFVAMNYTLEI